MAAKLTTNTPRESRGLPGLALAVTEHAPLPMATVDGATHIVCYVNPAFCRLLDKPAEQIVGKLLSELLPAKDECVTLLDRVFRSGEPETHVEQEHFKRHPVFWSYLMWPVLTDERLVGVMIQVTETAEFHQKTVAMNEALMLGSVRQHELTEEATRFSAQLQEEIRDRKQAEEALHRAQGLLTDRARQLESLVAERTSELTTTNKQLEALIYSIAHDLRAPLRSMQGFATMLVEEAGTNLSESGQGFANRINKSAQFMDALLRDLLVFSRIAQDRVEASPVKLKTVVESVLLRLEKEIHEANARVETGALWPAVLAHEPTLGQVLINLLGNALKFVRPDAPPQIRLHAEEHGRFVRVCVEDNGLGIAPEHQAQIFGIFTRLHGAKFPGTGIGLAMVQKGVERMGGRLGVESIPGQGSRFWFELQKAEQNR